MVLRDPNLGPPPSDDDEIADSTAAGRLIPGVDPSSMDDPLALAQLSKTAGTSTKIGLLARQRDGHDLELAAEPVAATRRDAGRAAGQDLEFATAAPRPRGRTPGDGHPDALDRAVLQADGAKAPPARVKDVLEGALKHEGPVAPKGGSGKTNSLEKLAQGANPAAGPPLPPSTMEAAGRREMAVPPSVRRGPDELLPPMEPTFPPLSPEHEARMPVAQGKSDAGPEPGLLGYPPTATEGRMAVLRGSSDSVEPYVEVEPDYPPTWTRGRMRPSGQVDDDSDTPNAPPDYPPTFTKGRVGAGGPQAAPPPDPDAPPVDRDPPLSREGRMDLRGGGGGSAGAGVVGNGLEGVVAALALAGARTRTPAPSGPEAELEQPRRVPAPIIGLQQRGSLSPAQKAASAKLREVGSLFEQRLDVLHGEWRRIDLVRPLFADPARPADPPIEGGSPADVIPGVRLGNGLMAELALLRALHGAPVQALIDLLSSYGRNLSPKRVAAISRGLGAAVQPVIHALVTEVRANKKAVIDATGIPAHDGDPRNRGVIRGARAGDVELWVWVAEGADDPLGARQAGGDNPVAQAGWLAAEGWSRLARWSQLSRRLVVAGRIAPDECRRGRYFIDAVQIAILRDDVAGLKAAEQRAFAWLEQHAAGIEKGVDSFEQAVLYALSQGPLLRGIGPDGKAIPEPAAPDNLRRKIGPWTVVGDDGGPAATMPLASLARCCQRIGSNPWSYLRDLFDAVALGGPLDGAKWTPAAWKARTPGA